MADPKLSPRYTFDSFVCGEPNQEALAEAKAVTLAQAATHNPLFIYGGVGTGKTHLIQAIGNALQATFTRVYYRTSEDFAKGAIDAFRSDSISHFRRGVTTIDALLIDDIQFLADKKHVQHEFLRAFDALFALGKQVVIASNRAPKELSGFEGRLVDRFEGGLVARLGKADQQLKLAILRTRSCEKALALPEDVAAYIATVTSTVRELDGALNRVLARCQLVSAPLTLETAQRILNAPVPRPEVSIENIETLVAERCGLSPAKLRRKSNSPEIVLPRQIAMYLAKQYTQLSWPAIGSYFGKHHTTALHSFEKIDQLRCADRDLNQLLLQLEKLLSLP